MKLKIVGLPIGNISDISLRALDTLKSAEFVVCEDSRMFNNLWSKLMQMGLVERFTGRLRFVNDFNEYKILPKVIEDISLLDSAVLVSDAGMPLISDPGYKLVSEGISLGWDIEVIPGPTAESAALAVSGLPTDKYMFLGFLPKTGGKRKSLLENIKQMQELQKFSVVIYESPQRTQKLLDELGVVFGEMSKVSVSIDLTKVSQKIFRGEIKEVLAKLSSLKIKGEVSIVLST